MDQAAISVFNLRGILAADFFKTTILKRWRAWSAVLILRERWKKEGWKNVVRTIECNQRADRHLLKSFMDCASISPLQLQIFLFLPFKNRCLKLWTAYKLHRVNANIKKSWFPVALTHEWFDYEKILLGGRLWCAELIFWDRNQNAAAGSFCQIPWNRHSVSEDEICEKMGPPK